MRKIVGVTVGTPIAPEVLKEKILGDETAEKKYELIEEFTLTEETEREDRNAEADGTAYNFEKVYVEITTPKASANGAGVITFNGKYSLYSASMIGTTESITKGFGEIQNGMLRCEGAKGKNGDYEISQANGVLPYTGRFGGFFADSITSVGVRSTSGNFPIGTTVKIYGVRIKPKAVTPTLTFQVILAGLDEIEQGYTTAEEATNVYQFEDGMTWGEFVESDYSPTIDDSALENSKDFICEGDKILSDYGCQYVVYYDIDEPTSADTPTYVTPNQVIDPSKKYYLCL